GEVLDQFEVSAFFQMREETQRGEGLGVQSCIGHSVGQAGVYKWSEPVERVLKAVVPVSIGASAAEALGRAAGRRGHRHGGAIVQSLVWRAHGKSKVGIAQAVIRHVRSCRGRRSVDLRSGGLRIGKIKRHARKNAEMLVEVVSGV